MADTKISALPGASTPLGGAEVVPVVQSSTTKNVSIDNLTAGRTVKVSGLQTPSNTGIFFFTDDGGTGYVLHGGTSGTPNLLKEYAGGLLQSTTDINGDKNIVGNLVIGTAGKGIDFSADGQAAGMTSELLDDYEEGTWTPGVSDGTTSAAVTANNFGRYTKVGKLVTVTARLQTSNATTLSGNLRITGLPFTIENNQGARCGMSIGAALSANLTAGQVLTGDGEPNQAYINLRVWDATSGTSAVTQAQVTDFFQLWFTLSYLSA